LQRYTTEVRSYIAKELAQSDPWDIGIIFGVFAKQFGARAPVDWISHQLFYDCVRVEIVNDDVFRLNYAHVHSEIVDFDFSDTLTESIDTNLCDWWLSELGCSSEYEEYKEWRDRTEENMIEDLIEFRETWHNVNCDGTAEDLSPTGRGCYDVLLNELKGKHEQDRAAIEAEAVRLGL